MPPDAIPAVPGLFLAGIPDRGYDGILCRSDGRRVYTTFLGTAAFSNDMPEDIRTWEWLYLPVTDTPEVRVPRRPLVNHIGDADYCDFAIRQAIEIVRRSGLPCFNDPAAIERLRRHRLPGLLAGIAGLTVPRCIRVRPGTLEDLAQAVRQEGLRYPVIARLTATHGGKSQVLVERPADWARLNGLPWGGRDLFVTQFHEYRDADGFHRKQRVAVVGDRVFPRHGAAARQWSVDAVVTLPEALEEEIAWSLEFEDKVLPAIADRVRQIADRVGLDYFGIDYSLRPDGSMLIFEVSAAMSMTEPYVPATHASIQPIAGNIRRALADLLRAPGAWRGCRAPARSAGPAAGADAA